VASGAIGHFHVAANAISSGQINVAGTPDGTKFLRDDYNWAASTTASGAVTAGVSMEFTCGELISGCQGVEVWSAANGNAVRRWGGGASPVVGVTISGNVSGGSCTLVLIGVLKSAASGMFQFSEVSGKPGYLAWMHSGGGLHVANTLISGGGAQIGVYTSGAIVITRVGTL
jgi:hypothetical protein